MTYSEPARTAARRTQSLASSPSPAVPKMGSTIYGRDPDEAVLFREMAPRFGVTLTITEAAVSEANFELASANRCISVGPKTQVTNCPLLALSRVGVECISLRSIGYNQIDVKNAEGVGISVGNVAYSPHRVADYTLMLMLMTVRHAKAIIRRADTHDYRLSDLELRRTLVARAAKEVVGVDLTRLELVGRAYF